MEPILTRCGYRCDLCLAYRPNVERQPSNQQKLSDGWYTYFGFRIEPEKITCDGCMSDEPDLIDNNCPVRPCVIERKHENCAVCSEFVCEKLKERIVERSDVTNRLGREIPEDDYICFIQPYENMRRLQIYQSTGKIEA